MKSYRYVFTCLLIIFILVLIYVNYNSLSKIIGGVMTKRVTSDMLVQDKFDEQIKIASLAVEAEDLLTYVDKNFFDKAITMTIIEFKGTVYCRVVNMELNGDNVSLTLSNPEYGPFEYKTRAETTKENEGLFKKLPENIISQKASEVIEKYKESQKEQLFDRCMRYNDKVLNNFVMTNFPNYKLSISYK